MRAQLVAHVVEQTVLCRGELLGSEGRTEIAARLLRALRSGHGWRCGRRFESVAAVVGIGGLRAAVVLQRPRDGRTRPGAIVCC